MIKIFFTLNFYYDIWGLKEGPTKQKLLYTNVNILYFHKKLYKNLNRWLPNNVTITLCNSC